MIYSPAHPCSCPELEFRGIKVFSGVNDLFFHIFQRRQICKYRGIHCELSTEPILPSLSDDVPLLSWPSVGGVAGTQCYRQEGAWLEGGGPWRRRKISGGGKISPRFAFQCLAHQVQLCCWLSIISQAFLCLWSHSVQSFSFFFLSSSFFSAWSFPHVTVAGTSPQSPNRLWTWWREAALVIAPLAPHYYSRLPLLLHTKSSQPSNSTLLTLIALVFFSSLNIFVSKHSLLLLFFLNPQIVCPNNFDAELKFNIDKEYDQNLLCGFGP